MIQNTSPHEQARHIGQTLRTIDAEGRRRLLGKIATQAQNHIPADLSYSAIFGDRNYLGSLAYEDLARVGVLQKHFREQPVVFAAANLLAACSLASEHDSLSERDLSRVVYWYAGLGEADRERGATTLKSARKGHQAIHGTDEAKATRWQSYQAELESTLARRPQLSVTDARRIVAKKYGRSLKTIQRRTRDPRGPRN